MMVEVTSLGKRRGLTGETLMYMVGRCRNASIPPQQAAAISTTYGTSSGDSIAAAENGLPVLRTTASVEATASSSDGTSVGPSSGMIDIDVWQGVEQAGGIGHILHGRAPALAALEVVDEGQATRVVEAKPAVTEGECVGAVAVVELVMRLHIGEAPVDDVGRDKHAIPLDPATEAVQHLGRELVIQANADLIEQGVGGLFDPVELVIG